MTYLEMLELLQRMTPEQLDCKVRVEFGEQDGTVPGDLRITDGDHDLPQSDHPVIYIEH